MPVKTIRKVTNRKLFWDKERITFFVLMLFVVFLFVWHLGDIVIVDEDAAVYVRVAREVLQTKDWITLHFNGQAWFDKPPLCIWLTALSIKFLGMNEFAFRLWHILFGIGGIIITYIIAKELFDQRTARFSSLILATTAQYFYQVRSPLQDVPLTFFIGLSLCFFLFFIKQKRYFFLYLLWLSLSLAVLTKGLVGIVLPGLIIAFYVIFAKKLVLLSKKSFWIHCILGFLIFLAIAAPWHILEYIRHGKDFIDEYFLIRTFNRYLYPDLNLGDPNSIADPKWIYLPEIFVFFLPWSGFLIFAFIHILKKLFQKSSSSLFILLWFIIILCFFSFSSGRKFPRYILSLFPALAIIVGHFWSEYLQNFKDRFLHRAMSFSSLISLIFIIFLLAISGFILPKLWLSNEYKPYLPIAIPFFISFGAGIVFSTMLLVIRKRRSSFVAFVVTALVSYGLLFSLGAKYINTIHPTKDLVYELKPIIKPEDRLACYRYLPRRSFVLYIDRPAKFINDPDVLLSFFQFPGKAYCITDKKELKQLGQWMREQKMDFHYKIVKEKTGKVVFSNYSNKN
ncbi:glycosyltransferase family 39 protein [Patescibacteria group bacterium]|nr:glycosyltransferase family 39 protein [Patescibacteria group bacterium]